MVVQWAKTQYQRIQRSAAAGLSKQEAKTRAEIATDGYPLALYDTVNESDIDFADPAKRKASLALEGLKKYEAVEKDGEVIITNADEENKALDDVDSYLPRFLTDTLADLTDNKRSAVIFNDEDSLKLIAQASRLDNAHYSSLAKLVVDKALEISKPKRASARAKAEASIDSSLLLTSNDPLERYESVIALLDKSIQNAKFTDELLNTTLPREIKRIAASYKEPMRSVIKDELEDTVKEIMSNPKGILDSDDTPVAVKSAILKFAQGAIEATYPDDVSKDSFAQKVISLIGAEKGSEDLKQAQQDVQDEILGEIYGLVEIDMELGKERKLLSEMTDSRARGTLIVVNGEYRQVTQAEFDAQSQTVKDLEERQTELLEGSLTATTKLKKAFEKLRLDNEDGEEGYSEGLKEIFWSRLLDTDGGIEKSWLSKMISADSLKDVDDISFSDLTSINPDDYEGVAKKLAQSLKTMAEEADDRLADEKILLSNLVKTKTDLDADFKTAVGIDFSVDLYDPAKMTAISDFAKTLKAEGNIAADQLVTNLKEFDVSSAFADLLTNIDITKLDPAEQAKFADAQTLIETTSHAELSQILPKLSQVERDEVTEYLTKARKQIVSLKIDYLDMLAANLEQARGRSEDLALHVAGLSLPAALDAGVTARDLTTLSGHFKKIDEKITSTINTIDQLEENGFIEGEFDNMKKNLYTSLQKRTQKLSMALINELEPNKEHLEELSEALTTEAKTYFAAIEDGDKSSFMQMIAELFQSILDKIGIMKQ